MYLRIITDKWAHSSQGKLRRPMRVELPDDEARVFVDAGMAKETATLEHEPGEEEQLDIEVDA